MYLDKGITAFLQAGYTVLMEAVPGVSSPMISVGRDQITISIPATPSTQNTTLSFEQALKHVKEQLSM
jgi:hypothetical protein